MKTGMIKLKGRTKKPST